MPEAGIKQLSDEQLRAKTVEFRARIAAKLEGITDKAGEIKTAERAALDEILPEAFAVVREAGWRAVQMRHFDVQLIGGMVLHQGKISEMRTGEGKTLVATLACYLNALAGHGVHVVTVNDYLAKRDAEWMGKIYEFLGLTVGVIVHDLDDSERRAAYAADITYGTNNEFGFDYLRDNMKFEIKDCVQRGHYYAIVDEVDSILIDEARTPLIISGPTDQTTDKYARVRARSFPSSSWAKRSKSAAGRAKASTSPATTSSTRSSARSASPTRAGRRSKAARHRQHCRRGKLGAEALRRDGHQGARALQARRGVRGQGRRSDHRGHLHRPPDAGPPLERWAAPVHRSQGRRQHPQGRPDAGHHHLPELLPPLQKLSGMTGTAETEAAEFEKIYKLEIVVIPTNKPMLRGWRIPTWSTAPRRKSTRRWPTTLRELHEKKQPVLVGTTSIEKSERLSGNSAAQGRAHVVLNAKFHEREAEIVAQAGGWGW
jgi:preprotein translocase subunit SecA